MLKFQLFFGVCLICLVFFGGSQSNYVFFWVSSRCWGRAYVSRKNESTPPGEGTHEQLYMWLIRKDVVTSNIFPIKIGI